MNRPVAVLVTLLAAACASAPAPIYVPGAQGQLHVSDGGTGDGVPLVFVHGNGANLTQWAAQLQHFRKSRRAIAYDLRGMGASQGPIDGSYSIADMAEDLHVIVNALNVDRFVLVGHSYGGPVVAAYAAAHPERVAGVVYADAAGDIKPRPEAWEKYLNELRMDKRATVTAAFEPLLATASPAVKEAVLSSVDRTSTEAFVTAMEGMPRFNVADAVRRYQGPTLAIAAVDNPSSFHVQFPSVPTRRMDGVGHWLMMERPEEFNRIVEEFLATLR